MTRKEVRPVTVDHFMVGEQRKYVIQGGCLPKEEAWVPNAESVLSSGSHDFLCLHKNNRKLASLLGVTLVRNNAFQELVNMRNNACKAEEGQARAEQDMTKDRVSKRAMGAWTLPDVISLTFNGLDPIQPPICVMQCVTDLRNAVAVSLDAASIDAAVRFITKESDQNGVQCFANKRAAVDLGDGVSFSITRNRAWSHTTDDDGMRRKKVRTMSMTREDMQDVDKVEAFKQRFWQLCAKPHEHDTINEEGDVANASHDDIDP